MLSSQRIQWLNPSKRIYDASDIPNFKRSIAYYKIRHTLSVITEKVKGSDIPRGVLDISLVTRKKENVPPINSASRNMDLPPPMEEENIAATRVPNDNAKLELTNETNFDGLLRILRILDNYIDETPPLEGPRRFGNLACRDWHEKVNANINELLKDNIKIHNSSFNLEFDGFIKELKHYIENSFGSSIRLDYGTGHELSFLAFIGGLIDFKLLNLEEMTGLDLLIIFAKYYDLVRRLILVYNLEPAGSHGVWGLDDHFHLIYILGAAQFNGNQNKIIPPVQQVLTRPVLERYKDVNLYVNAISFIHKIKMGPFNEHSPIIFDIHSLVSFWSKVLSGLLKMFEVEVLGKFPVVQHFWFGSSLYPWRDFDTNKDLPFYRRQDDESESDEQPTVLDNVSLTGAPWKSTQRQDTFISTVYPGVSPRLNRG